MATDNQTIIQRIKGLMRHADSAKEMGSLAEAETFTNKVNELLLQYNLEMMDVIAAADKNDQFKNWMYTENISYKDNQSGSRWKKLLVNVLTKHNLCTYTTLDYNKTFQVYGHMENVDVVVWMYNYLTIGLLRLAQEKHVALDPLIKAQYNRYAFLKDFLLGAVRGIDQKLEAQKQQSVELSKVTALIRTNEIALNGYLEKVVPKLGKARKSKTVYVGEGYGMGVEAGRNYNIGKPVGEGSKIPQSKQLK
jgi:hypothetical protein